MTVTALKLCRMMTVTLLLATVLPVGSVVPGPGQQTDLQVVVGIAPHAWVVERLTGGEIVPEVLLPAGQSPATYDPSPRQMARLASADLLVVVGVPFELSLLAKLQGVTDSVEVVDTRVGLPLRTMSGHTHGDHEHEGGADPHTWLDPALLNQQAATICDALVRRLPERAERYRQNLVTLGFELDSLRTEMVTQLAAARGQAMFVYHPAYGYLTDACGLRQVAVETDGKEPSARQIVSLIAQAEGDSVGVLFVQRQIASATVHTIARRIGARVVVLDPLARDYPANMRVMVENIRAGLLGETGALPTASGGE